MHSLIVNIYAFLNINPSLIEIKQSFNSACYWYWFPSSSCMHADAGTYICFVFVCVI